MTAHFTITLGLKHKWPKLKFPEWQKYGFGLYIICEFGFSQHLNFDMIEQVCRCGLF